MDPVPHQPVPGRPAPRRPVAKRRVPRAAGPAGAEPGSGPPLPRRGGATSGTAEDREPARDPDGRPLEPVDDAMLHRLLTGLRDI